jgi:hypothetical protein
MAPAGRCVECYRCVVDVGDLGSSVNARRHPSTLRPVQRGALTRDQLIAQIVFQISDLSARNGHHEFEEMCRHLAHQRIAPNVIPATGPVAAGGDQGRDFETFHSYIGQALGDAGWFARMVADGPIVGVCTLQKDSIASKILGDVEAVCTSEPKPERIYAFLGNDLTVARRHEIIDEARERHSVELDILDARGIESSCAGSERIRSRSAASRSQTTARVVRCTRALTRSHHASSWSW